MNRIIITFDEGLAFEIPIYEDFLIETVTEFASFADFCPTISSIVDLANAASSTGGTVSSGGLNLRAILDTPRWKMTNPIKITTDLFFYTKTDPYLDVIQPLNMLLACHLLKRNAKDQISIPGINAKMVAQLEEDIASTKNADNLTKKQIDAINKERKANEEKLEKLKQQDGITHSSFFSVLIPGVIFLEHAFIFSIQPTYSKHVTESGYPLWVQANVQLQSLAPGFVEFFQTGSQYTWDGTQKNIQNNLVIEDNTNIA